MSPNATAVGILAVTAGLRIICASALGPLADEAWYRLWSERPALGYYDQPPGIAVAVGLGAWLQDDALGWRLPGLLAASFAPLALLRHTPNPVAWALWCATLPSFGVLGTLATPDVGLLALIPLALRFWLDGRALAFGAAVGAATLFRHDAALLGALALIGQPAAFGLRAALAAASVSAPHIVWLLRHDAITLHFQASQALWRGSADPLGPLMAAAGQWLAVTPVAASAGAAAIIGSRDPLARWVVGFALLHGIAAVGAPPELHWPTWGWLPVGLLLSRTDGRLTRARDVGLALAGAAQLALWTHLAVRPLVSLADDPRGRFRVGEALADVAAPWLLPEGAERRSTEAADIPAVLTERYQEAALLAHHLGVPVVVAPECGRRGQHDLWADPVPPCTWFIRPQRSGPIRCVSADGPRQIVGRGVGTGEVLGVWDLASTCGRSP